RESGLPALHPLELVGERVHAFRGFDGECLEHLRLVREVQVEGAVTGSGLAGDVVDARVGIRALLEDLLRRVEEALTGPLTLLAEDARLRIAAPSPGGRELRPGTSLRPCLRHYSSFRRA